MKPMESLKSTRKFSDDKKNYYLHIPSISVDIENRFERKIYFLLMIMFLYKGVYIGYKKRQESNN